MRVSMSWGTSSLFSRAVSLFLSSTLQSVSPWVAVSWGTSKLHCSPKSKVSLTFLSAVDSPICLTLRAVSACERFLPNFMYCKAKKMQSLLATFPKWSAVQWCGPSRSRADPYHCQGTALAGSRASASMMLSPEAWPGILQKHLVMI